MPHEGQDFLGSQTWLGSGQVRQVRAPAGSEPARFALDFDFGWILEFFFEENDRYNTKLRSQRGSCHTYLVRTGVRWRNNNNYGFS